MLKFKAENHSYESEEDRQWTSVTKFISQFHEEFDALAVAYKVSENKKSKWYGIPPDEIVEIWNRESKRSTVVGDWYHNQRENDLLMFNTLHRHGKELQIIPPIYEEDIKLAPNQILQDGIYPEHMVYLNTYGLCGQSDLVEVVDNKVYITDYKTNKEIKKESYVLRGKSKKMMHPIEHLDDCNYIHYSLQLSLYMYMILKHNPELEFGSITIHHITFSIEGQDENGFPIMSKNGEDFVVKNVDFYDIPYMKKEVVNMLKTIKTVTRL